MKSRLIILTEIISPYRIPLFNALAQRADLDLHVVFLAETDPGLRQWQVYKQEIGFSYEVLPSWRRRLAGYNLLINWKVSAALRRVAPDAILCGGYNYLASWQALAWSRMNNVPFLLWSESNLHEQRGDRRWRELLKREFLRVSSGFVVPGQSAREYLRSYRIVDELIFTAHNAVDNALFASGSSYARQNAERLRRELELPARYFLYVGRLVPEKGVFDLLAAYAKLNEPLREEVGLVFVGDGMARTALQDRAKTISPGSIKFAGFKQRDELAKYYAFADASILPTYTDSWGLVVNEAMACGLPIIVSETAGCAADLVRPNWNGILIEYGDVVALTAAMQHLGGNQELCLEMGARSRQQISSYSPDDWADGVSVAVASLSRAI